MPSKYEAKKKYQLYIPEVPLVENWYEKYNFVLITSMEQLNQVFVDANWTPGKSFMAFDTETTGLNFEEIDIVGYSFCIDGNSTYYVPVNHFNYQYNLGEDSCEYIYKRMCEAVQVFMYNSRYDVRVFEYIGYKERKEELDKKRWLYAKFDMSKVTVFDVMDSVWLGDTNAKLPSLKDSSKRLLGYEQMHFDEVIESAGNFYYLNPSDNFDTVYYAAADALCTFLLAGVTYKYYKEAGIAGQLDNMVLYPLMHYESEKMYIDLELARKMYDDSLAECDKLEKEVYDSFGYQINLNSPVQVAQALERLGIDTGERTSSGNMATGMRVLENLPEETKKKFPALDAFIKYKEMVKLNGTYFKVYMKEAEEKGYLRASYKLQNVPTGRLSAGKDGKNSYFAPVNIQALPKPHVAMYDVFDLGKRDFFNKKYNVIMGYQFIMSKYDESGNHIKPNDPKYIGWAEGMNPKFNVRACVAAKMFPDSNEDEYVVCACDYAAQELRIAANLSEEPVWADAFATGNDVHRSTAIALWGEENYNKDYRKKAKSANFSILYGAGAPSFNDPFYDIHSMAEAEEFYNNYKKALPTLFQWEERRQRVARKTGTSYTYFGRPRRVKGYFDNGSYAFANRTVTNTCIQGTASDILKLVCIKLWGKLLNHPDYRDDVKWNCTIHDEIQYTVKASRANEIVGMIEDIQTFSTPEWRIPLTTEASLGFSMGNLFAFERIYDNEEKTKWHYVPKLD